MTKPALNQRDICFYINERAVSFKQFSAGISRVRFGIVQSDADSVLLFHQSSYDFAVGFFALALEGRHIVMPPNAQQQTLMHIAGQCQATLGDIKVDGLDAIDTNSAVSNSNNNSSNDSNTNNNDSDVPVEVLSSRADLFTPLDCQITFFTSGSTGNLMA